MLTRRMEKREQLHILDGEWRRGNSSVFSGGIKEKHSSRDYKKRDEEGTAQWISKAMEQAARPFFIKTAIYRGRGES